MSEFRAWVELFVGIATFLTSLLALGTAVAAVALSILEAKRGRRHERLSVQPHLHFFCTTTGVPPAGRLRIANNGLGPAIIISMDWFIDGTKVEGATFKEWRKNLDRLGLLPNPKLSATNYRDRDSIAVGESVSLVEISNPTVRDIGQFHDLLRRIRLEVTYESIYGERFPVLAYDGGDRPDEL